MEKCKHGFQQHIKYANLLSTLAIPYLLQHGQKHTDLIKYLKISLAHSNTQGIELLNDYFEWDMLYEHMLMWAMGIIKVNAVQSGEDIEGK